MNISPQSKQFVIQGITNAGDTFRPSDWAERLCGVMSCFRPGGGVQAHLGYSPYVQPVTFEGAKSVAVDARLRELEPLAHQFLIDFARDNNLRVIDICLLPDRA